MLRITITFILLTLALTSCSHMPAWLGTTDEKKLEGKRVALLPTEDMLRPSDDMKKVTVVLPAQEKNTDTLRQQAGHPVLPDTVTLLQKIKLGAAAEEPYFLPAPVAAEGKLFLLDGKGMVIAVDSNDLKKTLWKTKLLPEKAKKYAIGGGIAYDQGMLYASAGYNEVLALNAATGAIVWRKPIGNITRAAPAAGSGNVAVHTIDNHLYVLNEKDGDLHWAHEGVAETVGLLGDVAPVIESGVLYVAESSGELMAIDLANGQQLWSVNLSGSQYMGSAALNNISVSPVSVGNKVYVINNSGGLSVLDTASGTSVWKQSVLNIRSLWVAGDFIYAISSHNELACVQAKDGHIKWVTALPEFEDEKKKEDKIIASGPVLAGGKLYVALSHGSLAIVSPIDGKILSTLKVQKNISLAPQAVLGKLILLGQSGELEVFGK